jgi:hypothetical protein
MPHPRTGYTLFFGDLDVGTVKQTDSDFPNLFGQISLNPHLASQAHPAATRMCNFIRLNRESIRLIEDGAEPGKSANLDEVDQQLLTYSDYVESDSWVLVDDAGARHNILVPIFRGESEIVWRWQPGG